MSKRPSGTLERPPADINEVLLAVSAKEVEERMRKAERRLYQMFGITSEAYVGAEDQASFYPRWTRIFIDAEGMPPFNLYEERGGHWSFAIGATCSKCGYWVERRFDDPLELAEIREAPVTTCRRCFHLRRLTLVNVWTGQEEHSDE